MEAERPERIGNPPEAGKAGSSVPRRTRLMRGVLDASGAALLATGVWVLVRVFFHAPIEAFDEGVLLTGSMLVLQGKSIYRDFYTNYPPGIFLTISALWRLFGVTPLALRFLGLGIHVGLSLVAGRLAGRAGGHPERPR